MLKKSITFQDLDGNSVTEDFYFNLSKAELIELETSTKLGFSETIKAIVKEEDTKRLVKYFKRIILAAYGVRSEDGRRFIKSQELRDAFEQTDAYSELFTELSTKADIAAAFFNGIVPASIGQAIVEIEKTGKDPNEMTKEELIAAFQKKAGQ